MLELYLGLAALRLLVCAFCRLRVQAVSVWVFGAPGSSFWMATLAASVQNSDGKGGGGSSRILEVLALNIIEARGFVSALCRRTGFQIRTALGDLVRSIAHCWVTVSLEGSRDVLVRLTFYKGSRKSSETQLPALTS